MKNSTPLLPELFDWGTITEDGTCIDGFMEEDTSEEKLSKDDKTLSALGEATGGALARPPSIGNPLRRKVPPPRIKRSRRKIP